MSPQPESSPLRQLRSRLRIFIIDLSRQRRQRLRHRQRHHHAATSRAITAMRAPPRRYHAERGVSRHGGFIRIRRRRLIESRVASMPLLMTRRC